MKAAATEAMIAASAYGWLSGEGWDVYCEVESPLGQERADLVGVRPDESGAGSLVCVVEAKRELSFDLLAQARHWSDHRFADFVILAVPALGPTARFRAGRAEAVRVCREFYGFGLIAVGDHGLRPYVEARRIEGVRDDRLLASLRPEHKTMKEPGTPSGGHFTTYKDTCARLAAYVAANEGCRLSEALESVGHHYRSLETGVSALGKWIRRGEVDGVHTGWRGRLWSTPERAMRSLSREVA